MSLFDLRNMQILSDVNQLMNSHNTSADDYYKAGENTIWDSAGNIFTGNADWNRQVQTMRYNSAEAQKSRDWQERLSNTAYRRAVADLRGAGLNPYLAMTGGASPSSTPSGATAHTGNNVAKSSEGLMKLISTLTTLVGTAVNVSSMNARNLANINSREAIESARMWYFKHNK